MLQLVIGKRVGAITFVALTSNGGGKRRKLKNHDKLGLSSLPSTFPRVTKLANSIRASISSIVLDTQRQRNRRIRSAQRKEKETHDCVCAPCLHFTRPCNLFESGCFQAGADDSEDKRDERLEDDLAIEGEQRISIQEVEERTIRTDEGRDFSGLPSAFQ
jgi:hypothetical protein